MKMYVTYGCGYEQRDGYSVVEGYDVLDCIQKVQATCGRDYAFAYIEDEFAGQPERYGLHEIPLQPQSGGYD